MNFEIIGSYTEKLNIFNYLVDFGKNQNVPLAVSFRGTIVENDNMENGIFFKVYYDVESSKFPIVLNWVGVFILKFDEKPNVTDDELFNNVNIQDHLNNFIEMFSMNFSGKLPSFTEMMEQKS